VNSRQTFSARALRARRKQLGLSRELVALTIGRTYATIANYESGFTTPPAAIVAQLADLLECSPADLFEAAAVDA
jgi:transcriptional regulator with XRE-family HTH domain